MVSKGQRIVWAKANCEICGREYLYPEGDKLHTCGSFDCVQKYLHPEIKRRASK